MKLLAIDTSSSACSVALLSGATLISQHTIAPMQQARLILPMIQEVLDSAALSLNQLDAIAYGCGPGSFTGIRIASSVAQGLGFGATLPLIGISSLAALAQTAYLDNGWERLLIAIDARMEQIYWARYVITNGLAELQGEEQLCAPAVVILPERGEWSGIGDAWDKYKGMIGYQPTSIDSALLPKAEAILKLAVPRFERGEWLGPTDATPVYLR